MVLVFYCVSQLMELTLVILILLYRFYFLYCLDFILSIEKLVFYSSVN